MKIVLQHLTKKFPARGPVRGRKNREDVIAVNDFDFEIPDGKLIGLSAEITVFQFHGITITADQQ